MRLPAGSIMALLLAGSTSALAAPASPSAETLCAENPAYSAATMLSIVQAQLQKDHDPVLDSEAPDKLAQESATLGITDCAAELRKAPTVLEAFRSLPDTDVLIGWDAYNTACATQQATKGQCIRAEVAAAHALKHMSVSNQPPGAKLIVQTCELVMKTNPVMSEWRECVDIALVPHATDKAAAKCKLSVPWHSTRTGAEAGRVVASCLTHG